jgi:GH25 family lysozyme M1 (1,4-beta-N-acetylmuramidase)
MSKKGIDVSYANGAVDWNKIKASGVEFAILRGGYGSDVKAQDDKQFEANVKGCEAVGIPWGFYLYSYATTLTAAESEVKHSLRLLAGKKPAYPVYIDMEDADGYKAKRNVSAKMCADICEHFCKRMETEGYYVGIYANLDWLRNRINDARLWKYDIWLAQWASKPMWERPFGLWQYTSDGKVNGSSARTDMNEAFKDYPAIIKGAGLNGWKKPAPAGSAEAAKPPAAAPAPAPAPPPAPAPKPKEYKVGDVVTFKGGYHYASSTAAKAAGGKRTAGTAKVTNINLKGRHPVHLVGVKSNVYGWVDKGDIG